MMTKALCRQAECLLLLDNSLDDKTISKQATKVLIQICAVYIVEFVVSLDNEKVEEEDKDMSSIWSKMYDAEIISIVG